VLGQHGKLAPASTFRILMVDDALWMVGFANVLNAAGAVTFR
jgi:hypothetical protein